jgi:small subunit ribosomal protein S9
MSANNTQTQWYATGRRKEATARVFLRPGSGRIIVNNKALEVYFERDTHRRWLIAPLQLTGDVENMDAYITVKGGGKSGQSGAIRLGFARALCTRDPNNRQGLKAAGMLRRDARKVERKKYGQPGARKRFQFSKR